MTKASVFWGGMGGPKCIGGGEGGSKGVRGKPKKFAKAKQIATQLRKEGGRNFYFNVKSTLPCSVMQHAQLSLLDNAASALNSVCFAGSSQKHNDVKRLDF